MKKNTTAKKSPKGQAKGQQKQVRRMAEKQRLTVGLDLGDRTSRYCILDEAGDVVSESQLPTTQTGLNSLFAKMASSRIALEVGTHSPWVSRHLAGMGHEVIVANSHKVKLITESVRKNDRIDAQYPARPTRLGIVAGDDNYQIVFLDVHGFAVSRVSARSDRLYAVLFVRTR